MKRYVKSTVSSVLILLCFFVFIPAAGTIAYMNHIAGIPPQVINAETKKSYTYQLNNKQLGDFQNITAVLGDTDLKIKTSKDSHFYLSYYIYCYNSKNPVLYDVRNNTLQLNAKNVDSALYTIKKGKYTVERKNKTLITLYIPAKHMNNITLQADDADLSLRNISCQNTSVKTTFGYINVSGIKDIRRLRLASRDGDISLSNIDTDGSVQLQSRYGHILASAIHTSGTADISAKDGDIKLSGLKADGSLHIKSFYGYVTAQKLTIPGTAKITTREGDINLSNLQITGSAQLNSTYGYITLKLNDACLNNLGITLKTNDGSMSVKDSIGGHQKRYREYGWQYTKTTSASGAQLNAFTKEGDVSLR